MNCISATYHLYDLSKMLGASGITAELNQLDSDFINGMLLIKNKIRHNELFGPKSLIREFNWMTRELFSQMKHFLEDNQELVALNADEFIKEVYHRITDFNISSFKKSSKSEFKRINFPSDMSEITRITDNFMYPEFDTAKKQWFANEVGHEAEFENNKNVMKKLLLWAGIDNSHCDTVVGKMDAQALLSSVRRLLLLSKNNGCTLCNAKLSHLSFYYNSEQNNFGFDVYLKKENGSFSIATADHIIPHSISYNNSLSNLQLACDKCNNQKSNKILT